MCYRDLQVLCILHNICSIAWGALFWKCSLCFITRTVHMCTFQKLCHSLQCSADSISCLIPTGHGIWTGNFWHHPPYDVPDGNGNFVSPVLAGFYMFLTMIILLQVKDKNLSVTSKEEATQN